MYRNFIAWNDPCCHAAIDVTVTKKFKTILDLRHFFSHLKTIADCSTYQSEQEIQQGLFLSNSAQSTMSSTCNFFSNINIFYCEDRKFKIRRVACQGKFSFVVFSTGIVFQKGKYFIIHHTPNKIYKSLFSHRMNT